MVQNFVNRFFKTSSTSSIDSLIEKCGYAAAALTILPIPGSEIIAVMPIHVGMVVAIAQAKGVDISQESAVDLVFQISATVGLSLVGSRLITTASKIILPGLGGIISAPFMFASTIALGNVAKAYFEREGDIDKDTMKDLYKSMMKKAQKDFDPNRMQEDDIQNMAKSAAQEGENLNPSSDVQTENESPVERLKKLKELLDLGLISQAEFDETKQKILSRMSG